MSRAGQSRGNELGDFEEPGININLNETDNTPEDLAKLDQYLLYYGMDDNSVDYNPVLTDIKTGMTGQVGIFQKPNPSLDMTQSAANGFGRFPRSGVAGVPTPSISGKLDTGTETSAEFDSESSIDNDRAKSKVDNIELSIGLGFSFSLLLMGISTTNILYTILAGIVAVVSVAHYED